MVKSKLPPNVFPPLQLSASEKQAIVTYTHELVIETLTASEKFIAHHRKFNPERWKYVKTQNRLHVYRSRRRKSASSEEGSQILSLSEMTKGDSFTSSDGKSSGRRHDSDYLTDGSLLARARPQRVPLYIITGRMEGTVEDAAFGAQADNEARWRLRDAYIGDKYVDQKILATIKSPSVDDPFRFLGVKWATKVLSSLISQRDVVYIESIGMTCNSNGERVAYVLTHSYALDRVPELTEFGVIRVRISSVFILRPHKDRTVEVFGRAFNDMGGGITDSVTMSIYKDSLLSVDGLVECAYVKKLMWQMTARHREAHEHATSLAAQAHAPTHCASCHHSLRKFARLVQTGDACQVCRRVFCSKCTITKRVGVDFDTSGGITERAMIFCRECMTLAIKLSAWSVALETVPKGKNRLRTCSTNSTTKSLSQSMSFASSN